MSALNGLRIAREPNVRMCGQDCEPVLRHSRMARIPFIANRNLLVCCANTKRTGCDGCPFHALSVLCSSHVRGKLINRTPLMRRMRTEWCISSALMYTRFMFTAMGRSRMEIYNEIVQLYCAECLTVKLIWKLWHSFLDSRTSLNDKPCAGCASCLSNSTTSFENMPQVHNLLEEDRRMTISELGLCLLSPDCARTCVWRIIHNIFSFHKLPSQRILCLLSGIHKANHMARALNWIFFLTWYKDEGPALIDWTMTGNEMYVYHVTPETKELSITWFGPGKSGDKKWKLELQLVKVWPPSFVMQKTSSSSYTYLKTAWLILRCTFQSRRISEMLFVANGHIWIRR